MNEIQSTPGIRQEVGRWQARQYAERRPRLGRAAQSEDVVVASLLALFGLAALIQSAPAAVSQTTGRDQAHSQLIDFRRSPLLDLHYFVRGLAEQAPADSAPDWLKPALTAVAKCEKDLGGPAAWGLLEGRLPGLQDSAALLALADQLPEEARTRAGTTVALRSAVADYARALQSVEARFRAEVWPGHQRQIEAAQAEWKQRAEPHVGACLADIERDFALAPPAGSIGVELVAVAPRPHAVTLRTRSGPVCIVSCTEFAGTEFIEAVFHEATHALDVGTPGSESVLNDLRARLAGADEHTLRDVPHTLFFAEAAFVVRKEIDPRHRAYAERAGYYDRVGAIAKAAAEIWNQHLSNQLDRAGALQQLSKLGPGAKGPTAQSQATGSQPASRPLRP